MYAVISFPVCTVINFEINLSFLIKPFSYMTKKVKTKFKYLQIEKIFLGDIKSLFYHFWKAFSCQKLSQTWERAFKMKWYCWCECLILRFLKFLFYRLKLRFENLLLKKKSQIFVTRWKMNHWVKSTFWKLLGVY